MLHLRTIDAGEVKLSSVSNLSVLVRNVHSPPWMPAVIKRFGIVLFLSLAVSRPTAAQEAIIIDNDEAQEAVEEEYELRIDEALVESGRLRFTAGVSYIARRGDAALFAFDTIDIPGLGLTTIPTSYFESEIQERIAVTYFGMRYGLTDRLELSTSANLSSTSADRYIPGLGTENQSFSGLSGVSVGASYKLRNDDGVYPAVIASLSTNIVEADNAERDQFTTAGSTRLSLSSYMVLDPVVLTGTMGYRHSRSREIDDFEVGSNGMGFLSVGMSTAFNDRITSSIGTSYQWASGVEVSGMETAPRRTSAQLDLGLGISLDQKRSLQVETSIELLGEREVSTSFSFSF